MNRPDMIRFSMLALLGVAAFPAMAQPPVVAPTLPGAPPATVQPTPPAIVTPPPAPIPALSPAQEAWANGWLKTGALQGLMARQKASGPLSGQALVGALLDRAKALSTGRVDTADFLDIWALRPAAFDPRPALAKAVSEDRLQAWANGLTPPYAGYGHAAPQPGAL